MVCIIGEATVLQECVVETIDPENSNQHWIWFAQLLEGRSRSGSGVVLRAHAKKIARRYTLPDKHCSIVKVKIRFVLT